MLQTNRQTDSTLYKNKVGFGEPKFIGAQLEIDNVPRCVNRISYSTYKPWFDFKESFAEKTGIEFGLNYTPVFI